MPTNEPRVAFNRPLSEDRAADQVKNPVSAYREAMDSIANDDWEQKCSGLTLLQRLIAQHPDTITQNLHQVVLILIQEVSFAFNRHSQLTDGFVSQGEKSSVTSGSICLIRLL